MIIFRPPALDDLAPAPYAGVRWRRMSDSQHPGPRQIAPRAHENALDCVEIEAEINVLARAVRADRYDGAGQIVRIVPRPLAAAGVSGVHRRPLGGVLGNAARGRK